MYADSTDVRRIDMSIGEKNYWGKGIGTLFIGMLVKYAFECEHVDVYIVFAKIIIFVQGVSGKRMGLHLF